MKSPFPGMDPYLEQFWGDVHTSLTTYSRDAIQRQLPGDLQARVEDLVYIEDPAADDRYVAPDVFIVERKDRTPGPKPETEPGGIAVSEPIVVHIPARERHLRSVSIFDPRTDGRLVTSIEFLSLANKQPGKGQDLYLQKQREMALGGVNLVEIDLTRAGSRVLRIRPEAIPAKARTTYQACVWRAHRPESFEVYRIPLDQRLPILPIPLRESDDDARLDLQALIDLAYENGGHGRIDYHPDPIPPLSGEDAAWADGLLRGRGLR